MSHPRLCAIEDTFAQFGKERGNASEELVEAIDRLEEKIKAFKLQKVDWEAEKKAALTTI